MADLHEGSLRQGSLLPDGTYSGGLGNYVSDNGAYVYRVATDLTQLANGNVDPAIAFQYANVDGVMSGLQQNRYGCLRVIVYSESTNEASLPLKSDMYGQIKTVNHELAEKMDVLIDKIDALLWKTCEANNLDYEESLSETY